MLFKSVLLAVAASSTLVAGHGAIIKATGDAGGSGMALGGKSFIPMQTPSLSRAEHPHADCHSPNLLTPATHPNPTNSI